MKKEKNDYQTAMSEFRESIKPEHGRFLDQIDRYTGELRRQAGTLRSRIDELQGTVDSQRGKINDLARFQDRVTSLEKQLASGKKSRNIWPSKSRIATAYARVARDRLCPIDVHQSQGEVHELRLALCLVYVGFGTAQCGDDSLPGMRTASWPLHGVAGCAKGEGDLPVRSGVRQRTY